MLKLDITELNNFKGSVDLLSVDQLTESDKKNPCGAKCHIDIDEIRNSAQNVLDEYASHLDANEYLVSAIEKTVEELKGDGFEIEIEFSDGDMEAIVELSEVGLTDSISTIFEQIKENIHSSLVDEVQSALDDEDVEIDSSLPDEILDIDNNSISNISVQFDTSNATLAQLLNDEYDSIILEIDNVRLCDEIDGKLDEIHTSEMASDLIDKALEKLHRTNLVDKNVFGKVDSQSIKLNVVFGESQSVTLTDINSLINLVNKAVQNELSVISGASPSPLEAMLLRDTYIKNKYKDAASFIIESLNGQSSYILENDDTIDSIDSDLYKSATFSDSGLARIKRVSVDLSDDLIREMDSIQKVAEEKAIKDKGSQDLSM